MKNSLRCLGFALLSIALALPLAADEGTRARTKAPAQRADEREWTFEFETGALFGNNQFGDQTGAANPDYTLIPFDFTAALTVDEVSLDEHWGGVFRGNTEFFFRGTSHVVVQGIEDHFTGIYVGPRYNFVQRDWDVVPFVESHVGVAFTNSQGQNRGTSQVGQGQDFCFTFGIGAGIRYDIDEDWFLRFTLRYTHFSNADLSEPERGNHGLDVFGPVVGFGRRF